ncbi:MAG: type II secretion system ATPase GspE [Neptuniibacter sp.]
MTGRLLLPFGFANKFSILMVENTSSEIMVAFSDETPLHAITEAVRGSNAKLCFSRLSSEDIRGQLSTLYKESNEDLEGVDLAGFTENLDDLLQEASSEDLLESKDDAPVIRIINALFTQALKQKASDIHIETFEDEMSVRIRVDGVLTEILRPDYRWAPRLISRIKVMAKLDIAEKRIPQDGRVSLRVAGQALDVRVSTMPSIHGERTVLRLLEKEARQLDLAHLGMPKNTESNFQELLNEPHGIILVTGPTGSGKTTTLYAGLTLLNDKSRNILTIEDPVEYAIPGIGQTPVNNKTGMTFAKGLKAMLRQDPDVVMVGEIRDSETAQIAVQASLTGHLVLSTLHTNDSLGAVSRLMDIGVEPYLIASSLKGVLAQRLVRSLCSVCKEEALLSKASAARLGRPDLAGSVVYQEAGCDSCNQHGYQGRLGVYELLIVTPELAGMIHDRAGEQALKQLVQADTSSLLDGAVQLVIDGKTSVNEVLRIVKDTSGHAIV